MGPYTGGYRGGMIRGVTGGGNAGRGTWEGYNIGTKKIALFKGYFKAIVGLINLQLYHIAPL